VNILSMLARLEGALGQANLIRQMVLLTPDRAVAEKPHPTVNLVVGYNGSPRSQTALDITLWIAHQTRLATSRSVNVQVVYVVNLETHCKQSPDIPCPTVSQFLSSGNPASVSDRGIYEGGRSRNRGAGTRRTGSTLDRAIAPTSVAELPDYADPSRLTLQLCQIEQFEEADRILWQARTLAEEWRGALKTHLRFGNPATELRQVVQDESASLLILGCESADHPMVGRLGSDFPCPVLGIPATLHEA